MRVTNQMIFDQAQAQATAARDRATQAQDQVATGIRVVHPGDDPAAAGLMVSQKIALKRYDIIDQSISRATGELQTADGALQGVSTLLARAQQLAVQLGNDTYGKAERLAGGQEIKSISAQISQLMNAQVAGRYIFGGNVDNAPPFDAAGNYSGDTTVRQIEVAPGLRQDASVRGDDVVKGTAGGVDVFAVLTSLATALTNDDGTSIRGTIDGVSQSTTQVAAALTKTGAMLSSFDSAQQIGTVAKDSTQKVLAAGSEVDIFAAASNLAQAQQSLQAALAATARSFDTSLLNFLK
ncbi:MAG TPA: flagellar hook-associated protein FlgL [Polyangia bacterium]|nr:flagellar hook-associated protein FlgL [Polyangia bacterium]